MIATANPGKLAEIRALLARLPVDLADPSTLGLPVSVDETGEGYAANARLKAAAYVKASGLWVLADDSGLEVDALAGGPGLRSHRLAGPGRSDADRRRTLLSLLQGHPRPWSARFRCTVVLAGPGGAMDEADGECPGEIVPEERGTGGFGYDPIFLVAGTGLTMAELPLEEKNRISHRARAILGIMPTLRLRLGLPGDKAT